MSIPVSAFAGAVDAVENKMRLAEFLCLPDIWLRILRLS